MTGGGEARLFEPEGSAEGCAAGECLPDEAPDGPAAPAPARFGPERWRAAVEAVRVASARHGASLAFGRLVSLGAGEVRLAYPPSAGFHRAQVTSTTGRAAVEKALGDFFGAPMRLVVETASEASPAAPSVAEEEAQQRSARERSTEAMVRGHEAVKAVLRLLGGEIEHVQVLEPERPAPPPAPDTPDESA